MVISIFPTFLLDNEDNDDLWNGELGTLLLKYACKNVMYRASN